MMRIATLLLSLLMACGLTSCAGFFGAPLHYTDAPAAASKGNVVLVHGIFDNANSLNPLRTKLEAAGYNCLVPSLIPANAKLGLPDLAHKLEETVEAKLGPHAEFALVGYSMGGLIGRYYLQELGAAERCNALFTISTPHNGTLMGELYPGQGPEDMSYGSDFLAKLEAGEHIYEEIPAVSYRTPLDMVIIPSTSSRWDRADNVVSWQLMHPLMIRSEKVQDHIVERLNGLAKAD